jgi:hypothetical protein
VVFYQPSISKIQGNTLDDSWIDEESRGGNRFTVGYVEGHHGWMISGYKLYDKDPFFVATDVDMAWQDLAFGPTGQRFLFGPVFDTTQVPPSGNLYVFPTETSSTGLTEPQNFDLPLHWEEVDMVDHQEHWSIEANYLFRLHPTWRGGQIELMAGARYMEFNETWHVAGFGQRFYYVDPLTGLSTTDPVAPNTILADSYWDTVAENHVVGPQLTAYWTRKWNRWSLSANGKFFAGFNFQNLHQKGELGSQLGDLPPSTITGAQPPAPAPPLIIHYPYAPLIMQPIGFTHKQHNTEWSPGVELNIEGKFQLTRALSLGLGYNFFWIDGIARAPSLVDYTIAAGNGQYLGINNANNREELFMHGPSFTVEFNR